LDTIYTSHALYLEPYDARRLANLCGFCGENLKLIEKRLNVEIHSRGNFFEVVDLDDTSKSTDACQILEQLYAETLQDEDITPSTVHLKILEQLDISKMQSMASTEIPASESIQPQQTRDVEPAPETLDSTLVDNSEQQKPNAEYMNSSELYEEIALRSPMDKRTSHSLPASHDSGDVGQMERPAPSVKSLSAHGEINEIHTHRKVIRLRSNNQKRYIQNIAKFDINFGIGPAGTGKTYLAVAAAVNAFKNDEVKKILLVRPAVEAGEKLGFLPGDLSEKVNPYLRPLYDALYEMMGFEQVAKLIDRQIIEVCPLAYMRGRTLSDSFIILDESQNTTPAQMKMLLTRIGFGSKAVITGDITQVDLPRGQASGLQHALQVLGGIDKIGVTRFASTDVVRHPLVKEIIEAYDEEEAGQ